MPTTCTPLAPWAVANRCSSGISSMQGPHHEAQTLTSIGRPACSSARETRWPSGSGSSIAGMVSPRLAVLTPAGGGGAVRSEEHTSELQSLMRISYAAFCLKKKHKVHKTKIND